MNKQKNSNKQGDGSLKAKTAYNPKIIEESIYQMWEKKGYFASQPEKGRPYFSIVIPPPNVTGVLHLGHALNNTIQDILIRYYKMNGYNTCWIPGTDHAGIATQTRVEQEIYKEEKLQRHDLGRKAMLSRIWEWKEHYGNTILTQLKKLGCACDWDRTAFTMDEKLSFAVRKVFLDLFEEGLIYRGKRLINWSTGCQTALSNDELEHKDVQTSFWHIRYPLEGDSGEYIEIATTRPETMLADTAVVVHPDDERYKHLIGKTVGLPLTDRKIPIIADAILADPEKGTGAVKCTPAHDFNDYACGLRHNLEIINILENDGTLNSLAGNSFSGLTVKAARKKVIEQLEQLGLLIKTDPLSHSVAHCYRSHTVVEPLLSNQWFVKMDPLVELAKKAVVDKQIRFIPDKRELDYLRWLESTPDWCISRQIWWGHRIPIWYCADCNEITRDKFGDTVTVAEGAKAILPDSPAADKVPAVCPVCDSNNLVQDPDVLDTWFSSQLWPLSTLGWPTENEDLAYYYPTSVLVTARDILALWVARMVMMGMKYQNGVAPFNTVYITSTILDERGDIMSKSRGNGIDPLRVIEGGIDHIKATKKLGSIPGNRKEHYPVYGADALRYGLISMIQGQSQDIKMPIGRENIPGKDDEYKVSIPKLEEGRRFTNKIYQATFGFILPNCEGFIYQEEKSSFLIDQWLDHKVSRSIDAVKKAVAAFRLGDACNEIYHLFWDDFCSWYLESVKNRLLGKEGKDGCIQAQNTLIKTTYTIVRLLQPIMPFISENVFASLKEIIEKGGGTVDGESCMVSPWPKSEKDSMSYCENQEAHDQTELAREIVAAINNIRSEQHSIKPGQQLPMVYLVYPDVLEMKTFMRHLSPAIQLLSKVKDIEMLSSAPHSTQTASRIVGKNVEVVVPLEGLIDVDAEKEKLNSEIERVASFIQKIEGRLKNEGFLIRAPKEVVERDQARIEVEKKKLDALREKMEVMLEE